MRAESERIYDIMNDKSIYFYIYVYNKNNYFYFLGKIMLIVYLYKNI